MCVVVYTSFNIIRNGNVFIFFSSFKHDRSIVVEVVATAAAVRVLDAVFFNLLSLQEITLSLILNGYKAEEKSTPCFYTCT